MPNRPRVWLLAAFVFFSQFLGGGAGLIAALLAIRWTGQAQRLFDLLIVGSTTPGGVAAVLLLGVGVAGGAALTLYVMLRKTTPYEIRFAPALLACTLGELCGLVVAAYFVTHGSELMLETVGRAFGFPLSLTTVVVTTALVRWWLRPGRDPQPAATASSTASGMSKLA